MLLFVNVLNVMHVGVLQGEYFCNIPLGEYYQPTSPLLQSKPPPALKAVANSQGSLDIISLEEQRKMSHVKNKSEARGLFSLLKV